MLLLLNRYCLLFMLLLLLFSCNIEKRLYRPGFYSSRSILVERISENRITKENVVNADTVSQKTIVVPSKKFSKPEEEQSQTIFNSPTKKIKSIVPITFSKKKNSLFKRSIKAIARTSSIKKTNDTDKSLGIIACLLLLAGLTLVIIGAAIMTASPQLASTLIVAGLLVLLIALVVGCIADPSLIFNVLEGILSSL
jgi:hypothetical protein